MPAREPLKPRLPEGEDAHVAAPVPGRAVLFVMLAVGVSIVGGVATFAALTRGPRRPQEHGLSPSVESAGTGPSTTAP